MVDYHCIYTDNRKSYSLTGSNGGQSQLFDTERGSGAPEQPATPVVISPELAVFTIGYAGRTIDQFITALKDAGVKFLWDVRSSPWSRIPEFTKEKLRARIEAAGIEYHHHPELGGKEGTPSDFTILRAKIPNGAALMCMERRVTSCHRNGIGEVLRANGRKVVDIL